MNVNWKLVYLLGVVEIILLTMVAFWFFRFEKMKEGAPSPSTVEVPVAAKTALPVTAGECQRRGCSGEICSDKDMASSCIFKAEFTCYQTAECKRQEDGQCGFTQTPELAACLSAKRSEKMKSPSTPSQKAPEPW